MGSAFFQIMRPMGCISLALHILHARESKFIRSNHLLPNNFVQKNTCTHFNVNGSVISNLSFLYCKFCYVSHCILNNRHPFASSGVWLLDLRLPSAFCLVSNNKNFPPSLLPRATDCTLRQPQTASAAISTSNVERTNRPAAASLSQTPRSQSIFFKFWKISRPCYVWKQESWFTECQINKSQEKLQSWKSGFKYSVNLYLDRKGPHPFIFVGSWCFIMWNGDF